MSRLKLEKNSILAGLFINLLLSITGIIFYFLTTSISILFDALYSGIMTAASLLAFLITLFFSNKKIGKYPFGADSYENLFTLFKSLLIIISSAFFLYESISSLAKSEILIFLKPSYMIIYISLVIILSTIACILFWYVNNIKKCKSEILRVELKSSIMDLLISVSVGIAMLVAAVGLPSESNVDLIRNIIDKSMVIIVIVLFTPTSFGMLLEQIKILAGKRMLIDEEKKIKKTINMKIVNDVYIKLVGKNKIIMVTIDYKKVDENLTKTIKKIRDILEVSFKEHEIFVIVK